MGNFGNRPLCPDNVAENNVQGTALTLEGYMFDGLQLKNRRFDCFLNTAINPLSQIGS